MVGDPDYYGQRYGANGHKLQAIEGNLNELVWNCMDCGEIRTDREMYDKFDCE